MGKVCTKYVERLQSVINLCVVRKCNAGNMIYVIVIYIYYIMYYYIMLRTLQMQQP